MTKLKGQTKPLDTKLRTTEENPTLGEWKAMVSEDFDDDNDRYTPEFRAWMERKR